MADIDQRILRDLRASAARSASLNEQDHLAQRRKGAEVEKKIKDLFILNLSASASLREIGYSFTASSRARRPHYVRGEIEQ
jgi:hypothetical protein